MSADYIPKAQAQLAAWARNFRNQIAATPEAFGLMAADAAAIAQAVGRFDEALALTLDPGTKTKPAVADKDAKRAAMLATLRMYAQTLKRNRGISNEAKIALGLHLDATRLSVIPKPTTVPVLQVAPDAPLVQRLTFRDIATPDRKAKPRGVIGLLLAVVTAPPPTPYNPDAPAPTPETAPIHGLVTHQPYRIQFPFTARGHIATYFACWITRDGRPGPWSQMAQLMIAG
jgi:hypothetical protein